MYRAKLMGPATPGDANGSDHSNFTEYTFSLNERNKKQMSPGEGFVKKTCCWFLPFQWRQIVSIIWSLAIDICTTSVTSKGSTTCQHTVVMNLKFWWLYFSVHSLVFVLSQKIYQTLETLLYRLYTHLKFCQKYSELHIISSTPFLVFGYPNETQSQVVLRPHLQ